MPKWLWPNFKLQDTRLLRPFQVRDKSGQTLWLRARFLLLLCLLALFVYLLLHNNRLNLLVRHAGLEQVESDLLANFYPTYDRLYLWLENQGNLATTVKESFAGSDSGAALWEKLQSQVQGVEFLTQVQFGQVEGEQFQAFRYETDWELLLWQDPTLSAWILEQNYLEPGIYWANNEIFNPTGLQLFWLDFDDNGQAYYFLANSELFLDNSSQESILYPSEREGVAIFFSSQSQRQLLYPLFATFPAEVTPALQPVASERAILHIGSGYIDWNYMFGDTGELLTNLSGKDYYRWLNRGSYWLKVAPVKTQTELDLLAIVIPRTEVFTRFGLESWVLLIMLLLVIFLSFLAFIAYYLAFSRRYYFTNQIKEIIKNGENTLLEFKSSLRYDRQDKGLNKALEAAVLKSIAAFNNCDGGMLIIGVDDQGKVLGLKADYATLKKRDKDGFELHLRGLISQAYGEHFAARRLEIFFPNLAREEVCVVRVRKGRSPLYTMATDKNGNKSERFYIRMGNSCREIEKPSDIVAYQKDRFSWQLKLFRSKK